jgi:hypothetical protein
MILWYLMILWFLMILSALQNLTVLRFLIADLVPDLARVATVFLFGFVYPDGAKRA